MLAAADAIEFSTLRDSLDVSDSVLSKNLKTLTDAGYIKLVKRSARGRQRTWASILPDGRRAPTNHLAALREMTDMARGITPGTTRPADAVATSVNEGRSQTLTALIPAPSPGDDTRR